jgi:hypothetical protein
VKSYFCKPYHSWEKGSIQNRNGIPRRCFPKKHNWSIRTEKGIDKVVNKINATPMKRWVIKHLPRFLRNVVVLHLSVESGIVVIILVKISGCIFLL